MKIVVGASSFSRSIEGHQVVLNPYGRKMTEPEIIEHLKDADGLLAGLEPLNERVFSSCPKLRAVARIGIGMDNVDIEAAKRYNIKVSNTPEAPTYAVAEMTLAALLCICRRIVDANNDMHNGIWKKRTGLSLAGSRALIIGYGRIGKRFAKMLEPFGVELSVFDPLYTGEPLETLLPKADIISLHVSGKQQVLGANELMLLKRNVIILNSARGELIDEDALCKILDAGAQYWGDTFSREPYSGVLTTHPNAILTPHIATYTTQCREQMESQAIKNILEDLNDI